MGILQLEQPHKLDYNTHAKCFYRQLYSMSQEIPKTRQVQRTYRTQRYDNNRQWIYIGYKDRMQSSSTLQTLFRQTDKFKQATETVYFTPNGHYTRKDRSADTLRFLNCYVLDFDKHQNYLEVLELISNAGLPAPTLINKTNKGLHIYFIFNKPLRATKKTITLYNAIHKYMLQDVQADKLATGASRIYRLVKDETIVYYEPQHTYDFELFKDWREINYPYEDECLAESFYAGQADIMQHQAMKRLLSKVATTGQRNNTLFTILLACKFSKRSENEALDIVTNWFNVYCEGSHDFTYRHIEKITNYVYKKSNYTKPSKYYIEKLSGESFSYKDLQVKYITEAKSRKDRVRVHLKEWKEDIISLLRNYEGLFCGTQKQLAELLKCPLISLKVVLKQMQEDKIINIVTTKGRNGKTEITLIKELHEEQTVHSNEQTEEVINTETKLIHTPIKTNNIVYVDFLKQTIIRKNKGHPT